MLMKLFAPFIAGVMAVTPATAAIVRIDTPSSSLVLDASKGKKLKHIHYGGSVSDADLASLQAALGNGVTSYPDYGMLGPAETAVSAIMPDGNRSLDLRVDGVSTRDTDGTKVTTVTLRDTAYPFAVDINYLTWPGEDVIETWTDIHNLDTENEIILTRFASGYLPVRYGDVWVSSLYGSAKNEARVECAPLGHGIRMIRNRDGVRNAHTSHSEVMISLDGKPSERDGRVIGAALCYSGNYRLMFNTDQSDWHHFIAGIDETDSEYHLDPGTTFTTPCLALTYSDRGLGGVSRSFHRWGRAHRLAHGDRSRKVLLNSWEGVYFKITEKGMADMMADIASMGGELFVMDDGWFGVDYPRDNAKAGLGDWVVDPRKLPHGIKGLLDTARKKGIDFGIWIEPEMVNTASNLYREHPDWVLKPANREPVYGRGGTQLVLDMGNPAVQDFVFNIVDTLMTSYPGIDYIKWDANMNIKNHGSQYLPANRQSHLFIDYHRGFVNVLERIRAKYPDVTIQACASGGARANWGTLPWFDEFWVSDNTDALQRIYMQWGDSYFFPAMTMASHISASPNHQTQRQIPLKYRIDVAMSGRLGMEIQPRDMTAGEKSMCRRAIEEYKKVRDVIQLGDLYRLQSPYDDKGVASLLYASADKDEAVFFWWKTRAFFADQLPRVKMDGLDPDRHYRVMELNRIDKKPLKFEGKVYSGRFLMDTGLEIPLAHDLDKADRTPWSSRILHLVAEP